MKSKILLTTISAAVLATFTLGASAHDIALSPRAAANQIKVVPSVTVAQPAQPAQPAPVEQATLSPRAAANQIATVKGTEAAVVKCSATGSPKYLAAVGNSARASCCNRTLAECPTMRTCGNAK
jgi:hypothetical protein